MELHNLSPTAKRVIEEALARSNGGDLRGEHLVAGVAKVLGKQSGETVMSAGQEQLYRDRMNEQDQ